MPRYLPSSRLISQNWPIYREAPRYLQLVGRILTDAFTHRREDLEDILADPAYFQAIFHWLERVRSLFQAQAELGMANESIASTSRPFSFDLLDESELNAHVQIIT
jgi:hypothetical protein